MPKMVNLASFWKTEACGQSVLPDSSISIEKNWIFKWGILCNFQTLFSAKIQGKKSKKFASVWKNFSIWWITQVFLPTKINLKSWISKCFRRTTAFNWWRKLPSKLHLNGFELCQKGSWAKKCYYLDPPINASFNANEGN